MSQPIILYDIPNQVAGKPLSGNTLKARYTLAYKGLAFKTVWIELPDIAKRMKAIDAKPTGHKPDGSDSYTLPVIQDPSTGVVVSDSFAIAEYLEKTYPSKPTLFPHDSVALISVFDSALMKSLVPMLQIIAVIVSAKLNPISAEHFKKDTAKRLGAKWEDISPEGPRREQDWKNVKEVLGIIDGWYSKSDGKHIMRDTFSYADIIVGAWVRCFNGVFEGEKWEEMRSWHDGRWGKIAEETNKYLNQSGLVNEKRVL
ncbi:hypothetical protein SERLA73DRAFT_106153 [Serpula lacrymans var. lacrymans S7.3]|uniref:GST N-terminal domain-containing protein n=2 Tax=Serpula lacrymans var. lacrymans TaxID=341189 RepID=F8PVV4_SERL3|nr:uncharacterized protein SERLADRAFT_360978 [Serpula lacrymans var. lacrymans S7.9]EGN99550.1 hypothetical protein SERLA73DRAFT_106153 [Serpula lacrymans var. lacrymans S7.3]EGO25121.1 hypothetical protein SERLADRAFT_360978 [Serpula lacrymans var. lacrymans S7.9]